MDSGGDIYGPGHSKRKEFPGRETLSLSKKANMMQERTEFLHGGKALGRVLPPAGGKIESKSVFSKDMSLGKNTAQPARVRALRVRRSGLHPLEKMLAFLRSVSRFLDTLRVSRTGNSFFISSNACAVTRHFPAEYARYRRGWLVSWLGFNLTPVFPSVPGQ